jgi:hypothetical protein
MANNTESLAAYHLSKSKIHFFVGGSVQSVSASPSNHATAIELIYTVLSEVEKNNVAVRLGSNQKLLMIDKKTNRSLLGLEVEQSFYTLMEIQKNPLIYNFSKEIESGYQKLLAADEANLQSTVLQIKQTFNQIGKGLTRFKEFNTVLNDFLYSKRGLSTILNDSTLKGPVIGAYFGHIKRIFGLSGELNFVLQSQKAGRINIATGLILDGAKTRLIDEKTDTGKFTVGDAAITLRTGGTNESVSFEVPVSIKSSKQDNTKTFHIYKGNPSAHLDPGILVDFTNIYLSKKTAYRSLLASMIADFGLAGRSAKDIDQRPLFIVKQTPNFLGVYFFFEIYNYYAKNAGNIGEIPIVEIKDYNYQTVTDPSPIDRINTKLVGKSKSDSADITTGRTFYAKVKKDKMRKDSTYMNYKEAKSRVSFTASLKGVWPKFQNTRNSSMQKVHHAIDFYRKNPPKTKT